MVQIGLLMLLVSQAPSSDIDAFMEKVLAQRGANWEQYYDYFCKERAELEIVGSLPGVPLSGFRREFLWFVRDGYMVRSPVSVDGVAISADVRAREEEKWIERLEKKERERNPDREGFMGFKFEPGNYFYAGKKTFEGQELLAVEYYPEEGFVDDDEDDEERSEEEEELERQFNKTFMVTNSRNSRAARWLRNKWFTGVCPECQVPDWKVAKYSSTQFRRHHGSDLRGSGSSQG